MEKGREEKPKISKIDQEVEAENKIEKVRLEPQKPGDPAVDGVSETLNHR